jgi:hypothetical protein
MQNTSKQFPGCGKWDRINSTYKHEIFLKNGKKLDGYSKGLLTNEMQDKTVLLETIIVRLFNKGYLDPQRTSQIDFYFKSYLGDTNEIILSLKPLEYQVFHSKLITNERIVRFLSRFYDQIKRGKIITKELTDKPYRKNEVDLFSLSEKRFKNQSELLDWIIKKGKEGFSEGQLQNYFYKYTEKFLSNPS